MERMTLEQFQDAIKAQGKDRIEDVTFRCPKCGETQSGQDLIDAGTGSSIREEIQTLKKEAVELLNGMFNIPSGFESDAIRRIVDCIVSAAILEVVNLNRKAKDPSCLGCKGLSVHHTCGKEPKAQDR